MGGLYKMVTIFQTAGTDLNEKDQNYTIFPDEVAIEFIICNCTTFCSGDS